MIRTVVGFSFFLSTPRTTSSLVLISCKAYYYYLILWGSEMLWLGDAANPYPLSRAGTVLYVTGVNIILAMRIVALYGGKHCYRLLLGSLVVGEFFLCDIAVAPT